MNSIRMLRAALTRRTAPRAVSPGAVRFRPQLQTLEDRLAPATMEVPLDPFLDQFGNQFEIVMVYHTDDGLEDRVTFGIFDTGASPCTVAWTDQLFFDFVGQAIPLLESGGVPVEATAEVLGGSLTGFVSEPGTIRADGLHAVDFEAYFNQEGGIDMTGAAAMDNVQAMIGTDTGSPNLPTIVGTPILNGRIPGATTDGLAVLIDQTGLEIDLGALFPDIPEVAGLIFRVPDVNFVAPGTQLVAGAETTAPVRVPVTFVGIDNHTDPGLTLTESYNPVATVQLTNTVDQATFEVNDQTFLLDTGAQLSVISTAIAVQLGLDLDNPDLTIDVGGAGGTVSIPGFTIESLTLPRDDNNDGVIDGELVFTSVPIFVLDLGADIDGILGMNLLNTMSQMVYDPTDPDGAGPGGPSLQFTFSTAPREEYSEEDLGNLGLLMPMFAGTLGGSFLPQFITPAMVVPDQLAVSAAEGELASNTGTFNEPNGNTVTLSASVGSINWSGMSSGTWSWSLPTTDGPTTPVMVTITADAGPAGVQSTTFTYTVQNVAPTISLTGNAEVTAQAVYELQLGAVVDPGVDTVSSYRVNWGDGTPPDVISGSPTGQSQQPTYAVGGVDRTITVELFDEDGPHTSGSKTIHVNAAPAVSAVNPAVSALEGQAATNTGVFSDADGNTVQLSASIGTFTPS